MFPHPLTHQNAEGPDVRLRRVDPLEERLGGHPLDRQLPVRSLAVVVARVHVPEREKSPATPTG